jgi:hypothetical protein
VILGVSMSAKIACTALKSISTTVAKRGGQVNETEN